MAVMEPMLQLTWTADSPSEPQCYSSPAKCTQQRECLRVLRVPSIERLMQQAALELEKGAEDKGEADGEEDDDDVAAAASVHTYKKSQYWSKEVEEKLGLGGADPYGLLELEEKRWRASADEIRKAYRRLVLTHHPDKKQSEEAVKAMAKREQKKEEKKESNKENKEEEGEEGGEEEEEEDSEFKLLAASWELLGNAESRRQYDSIDNFNDYMPSTFNPKRGESMHDPRTSLAHLACILACNLAQHATRPRRARTLTCDSSSSLVPGRPFFGAFAAPFARQAKFSSQTPVPQLGDADTPYETVAKFYKFWFGFSSWRDFGLLAEHDYKEAEDREERRWMQRQNKNYTDRLKKDERQRVAAFVQLAYDNDPRVIAYKEKAAADKAAAKAEKEAAVRAKKDAEEAEKAAKEQSQKAASAAAEAEKAAEKAVSADAKREKEKLRSALKKARKELKALSETGAWSARGSDLELVAAVLEIGALQQLTATLAAGTGDEATQALDDAVALAMKQ